MKVSTLWLREWVDFSLTAPELAHQLTMAGLEVDAVSPVAGEFSGVIVAQVLRTRPHPDANKLTLCEVDANLDKPLQIVCGAANVRAGLKVALAMIGAKLPGDFKIKESRLRGELSQGMLCSTSELKLAEHSEGIMELEADAPIGMDLRAYLSLDDNVLDIDLTPNRADCFSIAGIAREVAALNKLPLKAVAITPVTPEIDDVPSVQISNTEACPRYCARIIKGIRQDASTPLWMSERLRRAGLRTVHPVVDVMNYVMLELGQPMHAFDLAQIQGSVTVRFSNESEQLTLLDEQNVNLNSDVLVIADSNKPLAMAGIMGGLDSSVQAHTTDILLESAFFNPVTVAGVARTFGLFSDSSQRFERGVDFNLQQQALERATALILSIAGGKSGTVTEVCDNAQLPAQQIFSFNTDKVRQLTGVSISQQTMRQLLESLGIDIRQENGTCFEVQVPSHRFDIQQEVDLVEEIIRLYGYDNIIAEPISTTMQAGTVCANEALAQTLSRWFSARGYHETISYSFVDPELQEALYPQQKAMQLLNPISAELSQMRVGMWPGLIAAMIYNLHRQQHEIKLFESGVVFDLENRQLTERACIAGLLTGEQGLMHWAEPKRAFDFYDAKGDLTAMFAALHVRQIEFIPAAHDALHPGQSAEIKIEGQHAGWIGVLHPRWSDALDLQQDVVLFEVNLASLQSSTAPLYKTLSKYPQIRRDLSFLADKKTHVGQIEALVRTTVKEPWLKAFDVFDVYLGEGVPEGKKSLAMALILQDDTRTLVDSEINLLIDAIIKALEDEFAMTLRE